MADEAVTPPTTKDLTASQLRAHIAKVEREQEKMLTERVHLEHGRGAIAARIETLAADSRACTESIQSAANALHEAERFPRGRKFILTRPDFPRYNPHRRLAVMERSFL